ncbi:MAG: hypothetical protein HYY13_07110 [Nitrospirae bacterium]|nr:hypothetical protein [Nitrospirota bacterium]
MIERLRRKVPCVECSLAMYDLLGWKCRYCGAIWPAMDRGTVFSVFLIAMVAALAISLR